MKKCAFLVASAVVCASTLAIADVNGDNVFGVMAVQSGTDYTLVAVPWCECSTTNNQAVAISNIVKTANLEVGDKVYVVGADGKYSGWELCEGASSVLYWDGMTEVSLEGLGTAPDSSLATAGRGSAIILYRQSPTNELGAAKTFYLYGQVGTITSVSTPITPNGSTLIAPPYYNEGGVNILGDGVATFTPSNGDRIVVRTLGNGASIEYKYDGTWKANQWNVESGQFEKNPVSEIIIPAGAGAWYSTTNSVTGRSITWLNVPSK